jgi:hypothetical protein
MMIMITTLLLFPHSLTSSSSSSSLSSWLFHENDHDACVQCMGGKSGSEGKKKEAYEE